MVMNEADIWYPPEYSAGFEGGRGEAQINLDERLWMRARVLSRCPSGQHPDVKSRFGAFLNRR